MFFQKMAKVPWYCHGNNTHCSKISFPFNSEPVTMAQTNISGLLRVLSIYASGELCKLDKERWEKCDLPVVGLFLFNPSG